MKRILQSVRRHAFWAVDSIAGLGIGKHYLDVKSMLESKDVATIQSKRNQYLSKLLSHATQTCEFYGPYRIASSIEDFPVIDKNLIRNQFDLFVSQVFEKDKLVAMVTSGSTGTPFKVLQDRNKKVRNSSDTIYFAEKAGFSIGDVLIYMKIWNQVNRKNPILSWGENVVPFDVIHLGDQQIAELIHRMENQKSTFAFLGYASALELICQYLVKNRATVVPTSLSSAIASSESLNDFTKQNLKKYFEVEAVSRYSNLENGIIAQQVLGSGNDYLINDASYFVEILALDSDRPVVQGNLGRIVVTDLFNFGMPMIRYDTGDIGSMKPLEGNDKNCFLNHVEGRKLDLLFGTDGKLVSSYIVYKNMWQYTEINQYQLIQTGLKDYTFKINCNGLFNREEQLVSEFKKYLGQDATFKVEYVEEIPLLASGKRKKIMNTFYNQTSSNLK
jgi:phenylacetate-CoA ligase